MESYILPAAAYNPDYPGCSYLCSPLSDRRQTLNTIIEDSPQDTSSYRFSRFASKSAMLSPVSSDDFPTPRASQNPSRITQQVVSPLAYDPAEFDALYDVSDDDAQEVPLKCSDSVKKHSDSAVRTKRRSRGRYPSIIIPSPSAWPTIQKLQKSAVSPMPPTPRSALAASPAMLSMLAARRLQVPDRSSTPSLDGSLTSEEMEHLSCPSTPDLHARAEKDEDWLPPVQLQRDAMETLHYLSSEAEQQQANQLIEIPEAEMQEVVRASAPIDIIVTPVDQEIDPVSALSIPSPGGFFSSLGASARNTWCPAADQDVAPSTSTAEQFYGVPWAERPDNVVEHVISYPTKARVTENSNSDGPPTARLTDGSSEIAEVAEIIPCETNNEYNEHYEEELQTIASANFDRTSLWLSSQETYLSALKETSPVVATQDAQAMLEESIYSPSKKTVRFLDSLTLSPVGVNGAEEKDEEKEEDEECVADKETVFLEGFDYLLSKSKKGDAYIHRQARADAVHIDRHCMPTAHRDQLLGKFEINKVVRPVPARPISCFHTSEPTALKERIARAQRERQALDQIRPAAWVLQAQKSLNGGRLLSAPAARSIARAASARVLDVGGKVTCDWAWQIATDYPHATVHTVNTKEQAQSANVAGPANHRQTTVPNLWTLPFPSNHFDVVSARTLYALLKTDKPTGSRCDEYDLCLAELQRVLKPGGYFEYSLLDADILRPGRCAQAMSVEFGFNLKTRGYDANATKSFVSRLGRAGFADSRRMWSVLPMGNPAQKWNDRVNVGANNEPSADGSTVDVSAMTGLVGAWAWESWMLKLQLEMGREEGRLLEGVAGVIEEGAKLGSAWRVLSGWARK